MFYVQLVFTRGFAHVIHQILLSDITESACTSLMVEISAFYIDSVGISGKSVAYVLFRMAAYQISSKTSCFSLKE